MVVGRLAGETAIVEGGSSLVESEWSVAVGAVQGWDKLDPEYWNPMVLLHWNQCNKTVHPAVGKVQTRTDWRLVWRLFVESCLRRHSLSCSGAGRA